MVDQGGRAHAQGWLGESVPVLFLLARVLLGLAIAASIASCWTGTPDLLSFGLSVGVFATAAGTAAWASHEQKLFLSDILLALASLSFAAMLGHMSQTFDVAEDSSGFFVALALGIFIISASGSSIITAMIWLIILLIAIFSLKNDYHWTNKFGIVFSCMIFYMINSLNILKKDIKIHDINLKIYIKDGFLIIYNNFLFIFSISFVSVNLGIIRIDGINPPYDFVSYLCSLIFISITFYLGLARFSQQSLKEHDLSAAILFGWFGFLSLACLLLIAIHPLDMVGTLTLCGVWIAEASMLFYVSFKTRHMIGLWIAMAAYVGLFCAGLVALGLAWSGAVAGLLIACLLALGGGLVLSRQGKAIVAPL